MKTQKKEFQLLYFLSIFLDAPFFYRVFFLLSRKVWKMKFWNVPLAVRLILQLPTAHAGRWNFPKCHLPNLATEQKKHSVPYLPGRRARTAPTRVFTVWTSSWAYRPGLWVRPRARDLISPGKRSASEAEGKKYVARSQRRVCLPRKNALYVTGPSATKS